MKYLIIFLFPMAVYSSPLSECANEYTEITGHHMVGGKAFFQFCHNYYIENRPWVDSMPLDKGCYSKFAVDYHNIDSRYKHSILRLLCSIDECDIYAKSKGYCK